MPALPVFKLGMLAVRQLSKYVANFIKQKAKDNRIFREYICIPPAQWYNRMETRTMMWTMKMGKPTNIKPLSEAAAIDLGASMLGEFVLFLICGAAVVSEVSRLVVQTEFSLTNIELLYPRRKYRQMRSERRKKDEKIQAAINLTNNILKMEETIEHQEQYIQEIRKALRSLGKDIKVPKPEHFESKLLRPVITTRSIDTQVTVPTSDKQLQVTI